MNIVKQSLEQCTTAAPQAALNLEMWPLMPASAAPADYVLLDAAVAAGTFTLEEVSEGGSVPELRAHNRGERPVLLVDGEEVSGAKQNRVFNLTILVAAQSVTIIPVSCVEAGRWHHESASFTGSDHAQYAEGRALRMSQVSDSMARRAAPRSDQQEVWRNIREKSHRMRVRSETAAMEALYRTHRANLDAYVGAFEPLPGTGRGGVLHQRPRGRPRAVR